MIFFFFFCMLTPEKVTSCPSLIGVFENFTPLQEVHLRSAKGALPSLNAVSRKEGKPC